MEKIDSKYLNAIEDEELRYIFKTVMENDNYAEARNKLVDELGISKRAVTLKFDKARGIIRKAVLTAKEEEFKRKLDACYDKDNYLVLDKIALAENIDIEELRTIFSEYVNSLTEEEKMIGYQFGFSPERLKMANVEILTSSVRGFGNFKENQFYKSRISQEEQFIQSVPDICEDYYRKNKSKKEK